MVFGDVRLATEDLCDLKDVYFGEIPRFGTFAQNPLQIPILGIPSSIFLFPFGLLNCDLLKTGRFHQPHPRGPVFVPRPVVPLVLVPVTLPVTHAERYLFPYCVDLILVAFVLLWLASRQLNGMVSPMFDA